MIEFGAYAKLTKKFFWGKKSKIRCDFQDGHSMLIKEYFFKPIFEFRTFHSANLRSAL